MLISKSVLHQKKQLNWLHQLNKPFFIHQWGSHMGWKGTRVSTFLVSGWTLPYSETCQTFILYLIHFYINHLYGKTLPSVLFRLLIWELKNFPFWSLEILWPPQMKLYESSSHSWPLNTTLPSSSLFSLALIATKSPNFKYCQMTPASTKRCNVVVLLKFDRVIGLPRELCVGSLAAWILMHWAVRLCSSTCSDGISIIIDVLLVWRMFREVGETRVKIQNASFNCHSL